MLGMSFRDWFAVLLWPVTLFYALFCVLIIPRFVQNLNSSLMAIFCLPAVPLETYLLVNSSQSLSHLFDYYFAFVVAGAFCCFAFFQIYFSKWTVASRPGVLILCGLAGPFLLFLGSNVLIQDYALARLVVEGTVSRLSIETVHKTLEYQVTIETKRFWATQPVFDTLRVGDRVRAEVGKGSQYIFGIAHVSGKG
jgi:hypothetical protein